MSDSDPRTTFSYLTDELNRLGLGYLHVLDPYQDGAKRLSPVLRDRFAGTYIVNGAFAAENAAEVIGNGETDLVAFGVPFLANPDLPYRYQSGKPLNAADSSTFYTGEERGYIDYQSAR